PVRFTGRLCREAGLPAGDATRELAGEPAGRWGERASPWWDGGSASIVLGTQPQPTMTDPEFERDSRIRLAAFSALRKIAERNGGVITRPEMTQGFEFEGDRIPFANAQVGIWRPV